MREAGDHVADEREAIHFIPALANAYMRCPGCDSPDFEVTAGRGVTIAQIDPLRVEVILPSALFGSVRPGMRAAVEPEFGEQVHIASVRLGDRGIDAASGTFGVRLDLPNPDQAIPGGLHCQVHFLSE